MGHRRMPRGCGEVWYSRSFFVRAAERTRAASPLLDDGTLPGLDSRTFLSQWDVAWVQGAFDRLPQRLTRTWPMSGWRSGKPSPDAKRILFLSDFCPWPLDNGYRKRIYHLVQSLARVH